MYPGDLRKGHPQLLPGPGQQSKASHRFLFCYKVKFSVCGGAHRGRETDSCNGPEASNQPWGVVSPRRKPHPPSWGVWRSLTQRLPRRPRSEKLLKKQMKEIRQVNATLTDTQQVKRGKSTVYLQSPILYSQHYLHIYTPTKNNLWKQE